uniref:Uncharacterized LOC103460286 n=1 Tax=Poecilia reticulata TaxID=8081 RepID=A0A3P9PEN8_POERE
MQMPRGKSYRRSVAALRRMETARVRVGIPVTSSDFVSRSGTGWQHRVKDWPSSSFTNHCHKLVIPEERSDGKFVLLIGASHLRSFADGIVKISDGCIDFGVMCTPGASAADLRIEAYHAVVPRQPDAVCVTAPSNNLTASLNPEEAGEEFEKYLLTVLYRWPKVFCTGFPLRLTESLEKQNLFQQEFHRRAAKLGIPYFPVADYFPLKRPNLWSPDGIHLSDDHGMPILQKFMWMFAYRYLEISTPKPPVQSQAATGYKPRFVPRIVVKGEERRVPSLPSSEWTLVRSGRKRNHSGELESSDSLKTRVVHHKIDGTPVSLRKCSVLLNPSRFSPDILVAMETVSPSDLSDVHTGNETNSVEHQKKSAGRQQVEAKAKAAKMSVCNVLPCESQEMLNSLGLSASLPSQLTLERNDWQCTPTSSKGQISLRSSVPDSVSRSRTLSLCCKVDQTDELDPYSASKETSSHVN